MKIEVFTACFYTDQHPIRRLAASCERFGLPLRAYGVGELYCSWREMKVDRLLKELKASDCDVAVYMDGADSWFVAPVEGVMFPCMEVLIAGEKNCYPLKEYENRFENSLGAYRFPCAGQFFGVRDRLIECLKVLRPMVAPSDNDNDQALWTVGIADKLIPARVDSYARVFQSMSDTKEGELAKRNGSLYNTLTQSSPVAVHFNGGADKEARMTKFEEWLK